MQDMGKSEQINAMLRLTLSDIADRAVDNETQNFAAKMSDLVGSEGTPFGLKTIDPEEYKREKAKAVKLVKMAITQPKAIEGPKEDVESATYDPMQEYEDTLEDIVLAKEAKPDYLDFDGDGDKDEPMKKALKDKEKKDESIEVDLDEGKMNNATMQANSPRIEKAKKLMGPSTNRKEGIQMVAKGMPTSEKEATKLVDTVIKMTMQKNDYVPEKVDLDEEPNEGNKFSGELDKAKKDGKDEFEVDGKKYKVEGRISDVHLEITQMIDDGESDEEISKVTGFSVRDVKAVRKQVSDEPAEYDESIEWLKKAAGVGSTANSNFGIREGEQGYQKKLRDEIGKYLESLN
jgi:hypothetical protein